MTSVAVAAAPLVVEHDGERRTLKAGELVPGFDQWPHSPKAAVIDLEKVTLVSDPETVAQAAREVPEYRDALLDALRADGYRIARSKA